MCGQSLYESYCRDSPPMDISQLHRDLNAQLYPRNLIEFASPGKCRIHDTTRHDELNCLTFLSRVELALQEKIFFWYVPNPMVCAERDDFSIPEVRTEFFTRLGRLIESQLDVEDRIYLSKFYLC